MSYTGKYSYIVANRKAHWDFTGLVNDTTNSYGIVASNAISQITDLSGNGKDCTQATGANKPTLVTGTNSLKAGSFDGGDYLTGTTKSYWKFMHDGSNWTAYVLGKIGAGAAAYYGVFGTNGASSANIGMVFYYDNNAAIDGVNCQATIGDGIGGNWIRLAQAKCINDSTYKAHCIWIDNTSSLSNITYIGETAASAVKSAATPSTADPTYDFQIGATGNNVLPLLGEIHEVIIYSVAHTQKEVSLMQLYLNTKYGFS